MSNVHYTSYESLNLHVGSLIVFMNDTYVSTPKKF